MARRINKGCRLLTLLFPTTIYCSYGDGGGDGGGSIVVVVKIDFGASKTGIKVNNNDS